MYSEQGPYNLRQLSAHHLCIYVFQGIRGVVIKNKWRGAVWITCCLLYGGRICFTYCTQKAQGLCFECSRQTTHHLVILTRAWAFQVLAGALMVGGAEMTSDHGVWEAGRPKTASMVAEPSGLGSPCPWPSWLSHLSCSKHRAGLCISLAD